jgi:hypothetical protein
MINTGAGGAQASEMRRDCRGKEYHRRRVRGETAKVASSRAPWIAVAGVVSLGLVLATRPLMEPDLGYHLEFGERTLETGRPVDQVPYLYTLPPPSTPPGQRPEPGPGSWYDEAGRYRFANANWLSQVAFAVAYRGLGPTGLEAVRLAAVLAVLLLVVATAARLGVPSVALAPGLLLVVLASYERALVRPELLGFVALAAQAWLLAGNRPGDPDPMARRVPGWGDAAGLVLLQALAVNVHSYFLLGLGLTLAVLVGQLGTLALARAVGSPEPPATPLRRSTAVLAVAAAGQAVACLANPWGLRLALLPVETLLYVRAHGLNRATAAGVEAHPWAYFTEFQGPFASVTDDPWPVRALVVLLVLAAAGAVGAARRRRWDWVLVLAGMTATALSMRRNIAPASLVVVPVALAAILPRRAKRPARRDRAGRLQAGLRLAVPVLTLGAVAWLAASVVTQAFFDRPAATLRFGTGLDRLQLPVGAAEWIRAHRPEGRIWSDFYSSSTIRFFSGGRNGLNVLTNTWAYPAEVLGDVARTSRGTRPFGEAVARHDPQVVVARTSVSGPLVRELASRDDWRVVHVEGETVLFLRKDGPNAELAAARSLRPETLDVAAYAAILEEADPIPASGLARGAVGLFTLGWIDPGIELLERAIRLREASGRLGPNHVVEVEAAGFAHAQRAEARCRVGMPLSPCEADLARAEQLLAAAAGGPSPRPLAEKALDAVRRRRARP